MPSRKLIMTLGKLMVAAAWADGKMDINEINALKDLMFNIPDITDDEWDILNMYIDAPVSQKEAESLLDQLLLEIKTDEDKDFVDKYISKLFASDMELDESELLMLEKIKEGLVNKNTGVFNQIGSLFKKTVTNRSESYLTGIQREARIDDYIKNTIYFALVSTLENQGLKIDLEEGQLRKLCLASGLMSRVAWADKELTDEEKITIQQIIKKDWNLGENEAALVAGLSFTSVMKGLDYYRLTRSYYECTTAEERREFIKTLFHIANSSDNTSNKEIEEIRSISENLHIPHREFIDAKLTISDDDRKGL
ncbi:TerB family tellurite resistance protein [candidate division KSB1 bacterium]